MITDEMIAEAAAELNQALIDSLPDPHECKHQFSKKFERKMEKLIHCVNHPIRYMVLNRVASILLVILIGFTMVMSFSPTARAAVFGWIKQAYESFYSYYFETDVDTESNYRYRIDPLPEGYTEVSYTENNGVFMYIYVDAQNEMICFVYSKSPHSAVFDIKKEEYVVDTITVNEKTADLYITQDSTLANGIIWSDEESGFIFYISGKLDGEKIKNLAESVVQCPY